MRMNEERFSAEIMRIYKKNILTVEDCEKIMGECNGDLYIPMWSDVVALPNNLIVTGDMRIFGTTTIKRLPDGLVVHGDFNAFDSSLEYIPDDVQFGGYVNVAQTNITSLPKSLTRVNGLLDISGTKVESLIDNLVVMGNMIMVNCHITTLPKGFVVHGDFCAGSSMLEYIPDDARFGGDIDLIDSAITDINLTHVNGALKLNGTKVKKLPDKLKVDGTLNIINTSINVLPPGLCVQESVYADYTHIHHISDNVIVGGSVYSVGIPTFGKNVVICHRLRIYPPTSIIYSVERIGDDRYPCNPDLHPGVVMLRDDTLIGDGVWYGMYHEYDRTMKHWAVDCPLGDYVEGRYIYADNCLTLIKSMRRVGEYTVYRGFFKRRNLITDGEYYTHCRTIKLGIRDIERKRCKNRALDEYKSLSLDTVVDKDFAIKMYRDITGACEQGTEMFINSLGTDIKESYTIAEIITLTDGQYGSDKFKEFFVRPKPKNNPTTTPASDFDGDVIAVLSVGSGQD